MYEYLVISPIDCLHSKPFFMCNDISMNSNLTFTLQSPFHVYCSAN